MTKVTGDFRQFRSVACREYTLSRDDPASQPKGWIQGNMRIGLVLEVTTSFQNGNHGMARGMGSPRHVPNRRRRTREGPEPACVQTPFCRRWHTQEEKDELTSCRGTV